MLEERIGRKAQVERRPRHPADMQANWANVEKAGKLFGWEPRVSLSEGIANLVDWYNAERSWVSQIKTE
jgi:UDP-glucuronate 4-epimerase